MSTVRLRRLTADYAKLKEYVRLHPRVRLLQAEGDPPERYQLEYRINSVRMVDGELQSAKTHVVEIALPLNYPRTPPHCRMLSPVFHPNIAPHAICVGDHWSSGEPLCSIVMRIGEMLAYQAYNVKSPLNGEAARWVEQNQHKVPLDPVSLLAEDEPTESTAPPLVSPTGSTSGEGTAAVSSATTQVAPPALPPDHPIFQCPACRKVYRLRDEMRGRKVKCVACNHVFSAPDND